MKNCKYLLNFLFNVVSVSLVLLIQEFGSNSQYPLKNFLLISVSIIIAVIAGGMAYDQYKTEKIERQKKKIEKQNETAKTVLTQIIQLIDRKTSNYRGNTYELTVTDKEWPYFYGVHNYLHEVCENLKFTIAKIIQEESSYVDVCLIYNYSEETQWKWLAGKSGISAAVDLNSFISDPETLYNYLLNNKEKAPIFCNDKNASKHYKKGRRDKLFDGNGSFYAMPITFSNNEKALVEAILLISTYGVRFVPGNPTEKEKNDFRRMMAHEVVPYYISIIQTELVALYMRHNLDKVKHI